MSSNIEYLLQLHRGGVITNDDLREGIRTLKELTVKPSKVRDVESPSALGNIRKNVTRRKKQVGKSKNLLNYKKMS